MAKVTREMVEKSGIDRECETSPWVSKFLK